MIKSTALLVILVVTLAVGLHLAARGPAAPPPLHPDVELLQQSLRGALKVQSAIRNGETIVDSVVKAAVATQWAVRCRKYLSEMTAVTTFEAFDLLRPSPDCHAASWRIQAELQKSLPSNLAELAREKLWCPPRAIGSSFTEHVLWADMDADERRAAAIEAARKEALLAAVTGVSCANLVHRTTGL